MDVYNLWSLRLGFSGKEAKLIKEQGIKRFLENSIKAAIPTDEPSLMAAIPHTVAENKAVRAKMLATESGRMELKKLDIDSTYEMKSWWLKKMDTSTYPLREKMVLFWHNHFVVSTYGVNMLYWQYQHNKVLRNNALGNFRELTKKVVQTNAMVQYLDNNQNLKGRYNENLSRELLELFTLGTGNYTEQDIKNGARGLAGLSYNDNNAQYVPKFENSEPFEYFGRTGNFKVNEMVNIIFEQKNAPYHITRKLLKWFIYDNPPEDLVTYYGDYLRKVDYEIAPFLEKIVTKEFNKPTAGSKIKDPLVYVLQIINELGFQNIDYKQVQHYLRNQSMDLYYQQNVKGWIGGNSWISAQLFMQRNNIADQLCKGRLLDKSVQLNLPADGLKNFSPNIKWNNKAGYKQVIASLQDRLIFAADENISKNFETILKHDFDPLAPGAQNGVLQLFNYMLKTPEFQVI